MRRVIMVFAVFSSVVWLPTTSQAAAPSKVVFLECVIVIGGGATVDAFSGSTDAPVITLGSSCAQAIATILDAGLSLQASDMSDSFRPKYLFTTGK